MRIERASDPQRRFVSDAAHELRTPLAVLRTGLEVTLAAARTQTNMRHRTGTAMGEVERLCAIAEDLLRSARLDAEPALTRAPGNGSI